MAPLSAKHDPFERIFKVRLLRSESPRSFKQIRAAVHQELKPSTTLERFIARQITLAMLDVERYQRLRTRF